MCPVEKKESKKVKHPCSLCGRETNHEIVASESISSNDPDYRFEEKYMLVKCKGCDQLSFRKESHDYESYYQIGQDEWDYDIKVDVFPPYLEGHIGISNSHFLPEIVRTIYEETLAAIKQGNNVFAGIGLRATVEAICDAEGAESKYFSSRINRLASAGIISKKDARNLQAIRFMGNDAAHDIRAAPKEAILLALTIVEHILETQYTLAEHAERILDLPIEDFKTFVHFVRQKLWKTDKNSAFTLRSLVGRDVRRIQEYKAYEVKLEKMIQEGKFTELAKADVSDAHASGKHTYKRT